MAASKAPSRNGCKTSRRPILNIAAIDRVAPTATNESSDAVKAATVLSITSFFSASPSFSSSFFFANTLSNSFVDHSKYSPKFNFASGLVNSLATQIAALSLATSEKETHSLHIPNKSSIKDVDDDTDKV